MLYFPELHYFFDQKDFPFEKAVLVTAKKVSESCGYYKAKLISPLKSIKETECKGRLPPTTEEKHKFIDNLVKWIFNNSTAQDLFALFLDDEEIGKRKDKLVKFEHYDDTDCWFLNLTEQQFQELKYTWKNNGLPEYLFYQEGKEIKIIKPPGPVARFFVRLGFAFEKSKIYTPKRWEEEKRKELVAKLKT